MRVVVALCLLASIARAQPIPRGEPATQGVYNPTVGIASDADASAVERNPALLGSLKTWSGVYLHSELKSNGTVGGRGDALFFALPVPYLSSLVVGAGVQWVRPPDSFPYRDLAKISLSASWRLHELLSFGFTYAHLASTRAPVSPGVDTLDLALAGHLGRFVAWGLVVHDVNNPSVGGFPLQRVYDPELAFRPFGNARLELSIGARFGERRGDIDPHFRAWVVPRPGLTLKADVEWRRDVDLDGVDENDVRVALGLSIDLERVGIAGFGLFGRDSGHTEGHGFTLAARVSGERYPTFWRGPRYLERVELSRELRGRKLLEVLERLRRIETEDRVAGVVVLGGEVGCGWAGAEELRSALLRLRRRGKHVLAFLLHVDTKGYLVASAAERVILDPGGDLQLVGAQVTLPYFKGTGELLGVRADFVRIGAYKSAPERYGLSAPSAESLASRETYLDDLYRHLTLALAQSRHLSKERIHELVDHGPYSPGAALAHGLVDAVRPAEEVAQDMLELAGETFTVHDATTSPARDEGWSIPRITVLHIEGDLVGGASRSIPLLELHATGLGELMSSLEKAAHDSHVRAIVLRIDSPGGSSLAADLLARELVRIRAYKPVVCSLGDVAASGGYYIAAACDEIFAAPSTLTGSIGIYTGKLDLSGLAAKLGVSLTILQRGAHAAIDSMFRPYDEEERAALMELLYWHYQRFVTTVARGRHMDEARVDAVGQGRIWSGDRARTLGLVDAYGGLAEAIESAARRSNSPSSIAVRFEPEPPTLLGQLAALVGYRGTRSRQVSGQASGGLLSSLGLPGLEELARALPASVALEPSVPQARLEP